MRNGSNEPYAQQLEEVAYRFDAEEDLSDGFFPGNLPYLFGFPGTCGSPEDVEESGGVLRLLGTNEACPSLANPTAADAIALALAAGTPGEQSGRARYRFKIPGPCEAYGVGISSAGIPPADAVGLQLVRGPNPQDPIAQPDVLGVTLGAESLEFPGVFDGPSSPGVAGAVISTDPDNDPALEEITAIEFALETHDRVPTGSFRLCTTSGCPTEFTFLEPHTRTAFPNALVCGVPASEFDPPFDLPGWRAGGGRLQAENPAAFALYAGFFVPEPSRAASAVTAVSILLVIGVSRRRVIAFGTRSLHPTKGRSDWLGPQVSN